MGQKTRWLLWGGYVVIWTTLLLLPLSAVEKLPGTEMFESSRYLVAKSVHVTAYAVMTCLSGWLLIKARFRWLLVFFLMGHATLTEIIQEHVPGRIGHLHDVAFDHVGITIGLLLTWTWWTKNEESRTRNEE